MQGIIPRSFEFLIDAVEKSAEKGWIYKLEASYLEVYCEELNDLLHGAFFRILALDFSEFRRR
jgi:kinesin family protein C1